MQNSFGEDMAPIAADLTEEKRKQLRVLLGNLELTLLYKASVHGYQASAFHERCDRQGPTLLVAYNCLGYIFGGYTSVDYAQRGQKITDKEAFLFSIRYGAPLCIRVNSGHCARFDNAGVPNFGQQLYFCYENQPVVEEKLGNSFSFNAEKLYGDTSELTECEVYKVKQSAGKSSFFNSINSIFMGHVTSKAMSGSAGTSLTTQFRTYPVKDGREGKPLPFVLCDTMGLEEQSGAGLDIEDISSILQGHVPDRYKFNPTAPFKPDEQKASRPASLQEKIHCVVYVIDTTKISLMSDKLQEKLYSIRSQINSLAIPQIVLMTKVDEACPHVQNDLRDTYASSYIKSKVQEVSSRLGVSMSCVLPVKNYSQELELELNCDVLLLTALQQMLRFANDFLDDDDDPI
ncbi:interferon-induced 44-like protein [Labeo rohita]|uniref:Interferon-induced 44-like protein n=1 Tax=Labeo rohita TaxID=84645 RepID=A0A498MKS9_LABRO|nr:interferon-induced 44-like protein [Labeo rohita]